MQSKATTVKQYLAELEPERRKAIEALRKVIKANLDPRVKEGMEYGMIGYSIPLSVYPDGYHCNPDQPLPFLSLGSQKNHMALYLFCIYGNEGESERFAKEWKAAGKKLDMGKSCVRFKKLDDVAIEALGKAIKRMSVKKFIANYEAALEGTAAGRKRAAKKTSTKKAAKKTAKKAAKKTAKKKTAKKASKKTAASPKKGATRKKAAKKAPARKRTTR